MSGHQFVVTELIQKRKLGQAHSREELQFLIDGFISGQIPDYQMSAWLMAVCFNEMSLPETAELTAIMRNSGDCIKFPKDSFVVDKHSTGGVGDKCTIILAPIVAACGVPVVSLAGRGLGHTGGTLDKLESIPGFEVFIPLESIVSHVENHDLCIAGQTKEICPADKKMYALRDVTGTVESFSLICASIMSKKLAEGISALTLDVKYGSGAFMKTVEDAEKLATWLKEIGELNGLSVHALITNMQQPLGKFIGNALEIKECIEILKNNDQGFEDTKELSLQLAAHMIFLSNKVDSIDRGYNMAKEALISGKAYQKFIEMCSAQGANSPENLPEAKYSFEIKATQTGFITKIDTQQVGYAGIIIKAGRLKTEDTIDPTAGIEMHVKINSQVEEGDLLFTLYANSEENFLAAKEKLISSLTVSKSKTTEHKLIEKILM